MERRKSQPASIYTPPVLTEAEIQEAIDKLNGHIEAQGMRKTPERVAILNVVLKMDGHHSADEILLMMPANFHVSRVTVYNALKLFDELGIVFSHQLMGVTLYECAFHRTMHHHYICRGCQRIWDFENDAVEEVASKVRTPRFRKMCSSVYIYGICDVCQQRLNRLKKKLEKQRLENMTEEERRFARISKELEEAAGWFSPRPPKGASVRINITDN